MEQIIENIQIADRSGPNILTPEELEVIYKVREKYLQYGFIGCTGCRYCMPCPQGVSIPEILAFYNEALRAADEMQRREVVEKYYADIPQEKRSDACAKCGACEEKCPQKLPIREIPSRSRWMLRPPQ